MFRTIPFRLASIALLALCAGMTPSSAATPAPFRPLTWPDLLKRERPKPDATIAYGPSAMQRVDVWIPKGNGPFKTVLMVHGGCWTTSIADRSIMNWIADDLRKSGYAVWNIDYSGIDLPEGGFPGTFLDTAAAADALPKYAARFHLDTRRIVAIGHSAGGHLALWLAGRNQIPKTSPIAPTHKPLPIAHVISLGGLPDLEAVALRENGCGNDGVIKLVGEASAQRPYRYQDTSPARLLPIHVSQDLINADQDKIVPLVFGEEYVHRARSLGDPATLHVASDAGHVELIAPESGAWSQAKFLINAAFSRP